MCQTESNKPVGFHLLALPPPPRRWWQEAHQGQLHSETRGKARATRFRGDVSQSTRLAHKGGDEHLSSLLCRA